MERVCPICNGIEHPAVRCLRCGLVLADGGALENYYGPYSPYVDCDTFPEGCDKSSCVHLFYCPECHWDTRLAWDLILI